MLNKNSSTELKKPASVTVLLKEKSWQPSKSLLLNQDQVDQWIDPCLKNRKVDPKDMHGACYVCTRVVLGTEPWWTQYCRCLIVWPFPDQVTNSNKKYERWKELKMYLFNRKVGFSAQNVGFSAKKVPFRCRYFLLRFGLNSSLWKDLF